MNKPLAALLMILSGCTTPGDSLRERSSEEAQGSCDGAVVDSDAVLRRAQLEFSLQTGGYAPNASVDRLRDRWLVMLSADPDLPGNVLVVEINFCGELIRVNQGH